MSRLTVRAAILALLCGFPQLATANPVVLFEHDGATDPRSFLEIWDITAGDEGTSPGPLGGGTSVEVGPLEPDPTCGAGCSVDAWVVDDRSSGSGTRYRYERNPIPVETNMAARFGWVLRSLLRVSSAEDSGLGIADPQDASIIAEYSEGPDGNGNRYAMFFGAGATGAPIVELFGDGRSVEVAATNADYVSYELEFRPETGNAALLIDGVEVISDYAGIPSDGVPARVNWGSGSSGGSGRGHYANVQWEVETGTCSPKPVASCTPESSGPCDSLTLEGCVASEVGTVVSYTPPAASIGCSEASGNYLSLTTPLVTSNNNLVALDGVRDFESDSITFVFDFSMSSDERIEQELGPVINSEYAADGFGVGLLDTAVFGTSGDPSLPGTNWEDGSVVPPFAGYYLSFDIFAFGDSSNDNTITLKGPLSSALTVVRAPFVLNDDLRHRAYWTIETSPTATTGTLLLIQDVHCAAIPYVIFEDVPIEGVATSGQLRAFFAGRNGALTHETQIDNAYFVPEPGLSPALVLGFALLLAGGRRLDRTGPRRRSAVRSSRTS